MAREGYYYWLDWPKYLKTVDETGLIKYINTGCLVIKTEKNHYLKKVMASLDELCVPYEDVAPEEIPNLFPILSTRSYGPPVLPSDERFGKPTAEKIAGAIYIPESGVDLRSQTVGAQCAARGGSGGRQVQVQGRSGRHSPAG